MESGEGLYQKTEAALALIAANRRGQLVDAARRIVEDDDEAEDVVQQTLTSVWSRLKRGRIDNLEAYVFRAVERNALKHRLRRRADVPIDHVHEPSADLIDSDHQELDPISLEKALIGLPITQQTVLRMKYYLGLTFREIGMALSISANTAASRCRYAIIALRRSLLRNRKGSRDEEA
jgi:RNA polymerase sigma-70 factor (ECF subfamily)